MTKQNTEIAVQQFCDAWQGLNAVYEDYARRKGIAYTNLYILDIISKTAACTQKLICKRTLLPRQTVNTVITAFYKKGWIELRETPEDRRIKTIRLTAAGEAYAGTVIPQIHAAERATMDALTPEQQNALLDALRIYHDTFRGEMEK